MQLVFVKKVRILKAQYCTISSRAYVLSRKSWRKTSHITNLNSKLVRACKRANFTFLNVNCTYRISNLEFGIIYWILNFVFQKFHLELETRGSENTLLGFRGIGL